MKFFLHSSPPYPPYPKGRAPNVRLEQHTMHEKGLNLTGYAAFISESLAQDTDPEAFVSYDDLLNCLNNYAKQTGDPFLSRVFDGKQVRISNSTLKGS